MEIPDHITDLTQRDFAEIRRACNPINGLAIRVEKHEDDYQIHVDDYALRRIIWALLHGGIATCSIDQVDDIPIDPAEV